MRKKFIAGNWKMNCGPAEGAALVSALLPLVAGKESVDIAICPPFLTIPSIAGTIAGSPIQLGAQNTYAAESGGKPVLSGAYTGEVSPTMLAEAGVTWVILGHSERRQYFAETDATVNAKAKGCFAAGLKVIICVGELLEEREAGKTASVIDTQIRGCFAGLPAEKVKESVVAYEPVWAIGTGKTATPEMAQKVHAQIRAILTELYGADVANAIRIQYGGSMKPSNAKELLAQPDIDGGLIGGAALKAEDFAGIIDAALS